MKRIALLGLAIFSPVVVFAQNATQLFSLLTIVEKTLGYIMPIVIILGVLYVMWGVISFVTKTNEEERAKAKSVILYGIIGLFVIMSIWGLVGFLQNLTGVGTGTGPVIPCVIGSGPNCQ